MEEEKGERDPRRKGKERMIRKGSGIVKRERRGRPFDQRGHWKKREVFGKGGRFSRIKIIKASWTRVLFDDDDVVFHLRIGSVSDDDDDDDDSWKKERREEESQKINLEGGS